MDSSRRGLLTFGSRRSTWISRAAVSASTSLRTNQNSVLSMSAWPSNSRTACLGPVADRVDDCRVAQRGISDAAATRPRRLDSSRLAKSPRQLPGVPAALMSPRLMALAGRAMIALSRRSTLWPISTDASSVRACSIVISALLSSNSCSFRPGPPSPGSARRHAGGAVGRESRETRTYPDCASTPTCSKQQRLVERMLYRPGFRFLATSTRPTTSAAETSSASQIRNNVATVGDFRFRSSWLTYGRESPARNESSSWVSPARLRAFRNSSPIMGRKVADRWTTCR